jgi:predicted nuclease with TOPRIM domain
MDGNVVMFAVLGIVNVYLIFIMSDIKASLRSKVDAETLKEKFSLKDEILDANLANIRQKSNELNQDVESLHASVEDLKEIVRTFSGEVLQIKQRLEAFTAQMRATLDSALLKVYQQERSAK